MSRLHSCWVGDSWESRNNHRLTAGSFLQADISKKSFFFIFDCPRSQCQRHQDNRIYLFPAFQVKTTLNYLHSRNNKFTIAAKVVYRCIQRNGMGPHSFLWKLPIGAWSQSLTYRFSPPHLCDPQIIHWFTFSQCSSVGKVLWASYDRRHRCKLGSKHGALPVTSSYYTCMEMSSKTFMNVPTNIFLTIVFLALTFEWWGDKYQGSSARSLSGIWQLEFQIEQTWAILTF